MPFVVRKAKNLGMTNIKAKGGYNVGIMKNKKFYPYYVASTRKSLYSSRDEAERVRRRLNVRFRSY